MKLKLPDENTKWFAAIHVIHTSDQVLVWLGIFQFFGGTNISGKVKMLETNPALDTPPAHLQGEPIGHLYIVQHCFGMNFVFPEPATDDAFANATDDFDIARTRQLRCLAKLKKWNRNLANAPKCFLTSLCSNSAAALHCERCKLILLTLLRTYRRQCKSERDHRNFYFALLARTRKLHGA